MELVYWYDKMSKTFREKYIRRSIMGVNGLDMIISNPSIIMDATSLTGRIYKLSQIVGLAMEGSSAYNYFIPTSNGIVVQLRISSHENNNMQLYNKHEKNGKPNKRFMIVFCNTESMNIETQNVDGVENNNIHIPAIYLFDSKNVKYIVDIIRSILLTGTLPNGFPQKLKEQTTYRNLKQIAKITNKRRFIEPQLNHMITESVNRVIRKYLR